MREPVPVTGFIVGAFFIAGVIQAMHRACDLSREERVRGDGEITRGIGGVFAIMTVVMVGSVITI